MNITVEVEESVLRAACAHAAVRQTTVDALVREYLERLASDQTTIEAARARLRKLSEQSRAEFGAEYRFDRESLYDR